MEVDLLHEDRIPLWYLSQFLHNNLKNHKTFAIKKNNKMAKTK